MLRFERKRGGRYSLIALLMLALGLLIFFGERIQATLTPASDYEVEDVQLFEDYGVVESAFYELEQKSDVVGVEKGRHESGDYSVTPSFTKLEEGSDDPVTSAKSWTQYEKKTIKK